MRISMPITDELNEELYLYNFLRQLFIKEPSKEFLTEISRIEIIQDTNSPFSEGLAMLVAGAKDNADRLDEWEEELGVEYARLFIGPFNPPAIPFASFYLSETRSLMTDETIDVRKRYLDAGMSVKDLYSTPDDHIGIELEFVYDLTRRIIESVETGKEDEAARLSGIRNNFISQHMETWVPLFAEKVLAATDNTFYAGASKMLKDAFS
jgi:putative dimethyl sulfoxide reductase chaperone